MQKVHFKPTEAFLEKANKVFDEQKLVIKKVIPSSDVQHIGSTAIPGSITKGDIDVVIRVSPDEFKIATEKLKEMYAINQPENWSATFASFKDDQSFGIDFGAQLVVTGSKSDDFVKLKNILVNDPSLVAEYNAMKTKYEGKDMEEYRKAKADFFQRLREQSA